MGVWAGRPIHGQWIGREGEVGDGLAADEVFADDPFEILGRAAAVPGALGIHHGDGALHADAQAVDLAPVDAALDVHETQLLEPTLEKGPGRFLLFAGGAVTADAQQDVAPVLAEAEDTRLQLEAGRGHRGANYSVGTGSTLCAEGRTPDVEAGYCT